jgi:hypothetical protein
MSYLKNSFQSKEKKVISPSLFIYKPTIESLYSILIRILGCLLFLEFLFLVLTLGDSFLFGDFFFSIKNLFGNIFFIYLIKLIYFIFILINKEIFFGLLLFIFLIFLLNHSHLGYRHSLIRGAFKGTFAYPFQRWLILNLNFLKKIFRIITIKIHIQAN